MKLKIWCENLQREDKETKGTLDTLKTTHAESEKRVQFLMDRLVSLLSSDSNDNVKGDLVQTLHARDKELVGLTL